MIDEASRWSGADWAQQPKDVMLIGLGGIGSWTAIALSRIGHRLLLVDGDIVDKSNIRGGQAYRGGDVGKFKVDAIADVCRILDDMNEYLMYDVIVDCRDYLSERCVYVDNRDGIANCLEENSPIYFSGLKYVTYFNCNGMFQLVEGGQCCTTTCCGLCPTRGLFIYEIYIFINW